MATAGVGEGWGDARATASWRASDRSMIACDVGRRRTVAPAALARHPLDGALRMARRGDEVANAIVFDQAMLLICSVGPPACTRLKDIALVTKKSTALEEWGCEPRRAVVGSTSAAAAPRLRGLDLRTRSRVGVR